MTPRTNPPASLPIKLYSCLILAGTAFSHVFLLAIRVIWGSQFFIAGKGKLTNLDKATGYFRDLGIPAPHLNAIVASSTETFGGLLLLIGLASRLVSIPLSITMTVAYLTAHRPDIHSMDDFVKATPFPFLFTALTVFCFGPGLFSVDGGLLWWRRNHCPTLLKT